jgi:hypothetical protein
VVEGEITEENMVERGRSGRKYEREGQTTAENMVEGQITEEDMVERGR